MSSNKIRTIDDNYRIDSFEDRVCDDLCEVLLQFLPLKVKFKFECVSKQFQRTVFQSQEELVYKILFGNKIEFNLQDGKLCSPLESPQLEALLKKLPNIKSLIFDFPLNLNKSEIDIIIKYYHKLTQIQFNYNNNPKESHQIFEKKFKQFIENNKRLTHLTIHMDFYNKNLLASVFRHLTKLDQLVSLSIGGGDTIIDTINTIIDGLRQLSDKLLKLKSLIIDTSINSLALFLSFMSVVKNSKLWKDFRLYYISTNTTKS